MLRRSLLALMVAALLAGCGSSRCGGGARTNLSVWSEPRQVGTAFSVSDAAPGASWHVVVVHEGHVAWRGTVDADAHGAFKLVRRLPDYAGADHVSVRAYGPSGRTCSASATLS